MSVIGASSSATLGVHEVVDLSSHSIACWPIVKSKLWEPYLWRLPSRSWKSSVYAKQLDNGHKLTCQNASSWICNCTKAIGRMK